MERRVAVIYGDRITPLETLDAEVMQSSHDYRGQVAIDIPQTAECGLLRTRFVPEHLVDQLRVSDPLVEVVEGDGDPALSQTTRCLGRDLADATARHQKHNQE
jgi:hypothetical protein